MKKYVVVVLSFILLLSITTLAGASDTIKLFVNGNEIYTDVSPQIIDGRTMVPIRAVSDAFGADINWNGDTRSVNISLSTASTADRNEYNNFVTECNTKISEDSYNRKMSIRSDSELSEAYAALLKSSRTYDSLINQAMLIHPPSDKAEEHNQRLKNLFDRKTGVDLAIRSVEELEKGNVDESKILMLESAKFLL